MQNPPETPEQLFARSLRSLRNHTKMSQVHVATVLHMDHGLKLDPTAITRIEKGSRAVRLNEAVAIASVFGQSVEEMMEPSNSPEEQLARAVERLEETGRRWEAAMKAARARLEQRADVVAFLADPRSEDDDGECKAET